MDTATRLDQRALARFELPVVKLDADGVCTYANVAAAELLGAPSPTGWSLRDLFPKPGQADLVQEELRKRLEGEASSYLTEFTRPGDGQDVPVSIYAFPVLDASDRVSGSMAIVTDLRVSRARKRMHEAIESCRDGAALLASIAGEARKLVRFDEFRVTALGKGRQHLRTLFSTDADRAETYPFKWWPMPPFVARLVEDDTPRTYDIPALFRQPEFAAMAAEDEATSAYRDSGVTSSLAIPVVSGDRTIAIVSFDTKGQPYTDADLAQCEKLPLAEATKMALHLEEEKTVGACLALIRDMGSAQGGVQRVAQVLVDSLAASFGWEHVAVFQRDEDRNCFLVLAQASAAGHSLDRDFTATEQGLVARAFRERRTVNVPDVREALAAGEGFQPGVAGVLSALAMPIRGERDRWVLNVESKLLRAFADEEIALLEPLLVDAGHILEQLALAEMQAAILAGINDAVIETNQRGVIRSLNPAAAELLGFGSTEGLLGQPLARFIASDDPAQALLQAGGGFSRREARLVAEGGREVPVLLSGSDLKQGSGRKVFFASDLSYQEQVERSGMLKDVFRHASLECRVPLALATGWLDGLAEKKRELEPEIERVLEQIRKADMPLERLLRAADPPVAEPQPAGATDLGRVLREVLEQFPQSDRESVLPDLPAGEVPVHGNCDDLRFCVETALSFALRTRPQSSKVKLEMKVDEELATFSVAGDWEPALGSDPAPAIRRRWRRTAASDLALAEDVLEDLARRAHGSFRSVMDGGLELSFELPLAKEA